MGLENDTPKTQKSAAGKSTRSSLLDHPSNEEGQVFIEEDQDSPQVNVMLSRLQCAHLQYAYAGETYETRHYRFVVPALFMSALLSVLVAIEPSDLPEKYKLLYKTLLALMSAMATFLLSWEKIEKVQYKKEAFQSAAQQADSFVHRLRSRIAGLKGYTTRQEVQALLDQTEVTMGEIRASLPPMAASIRDAFFEKYKKEPSVDLEMAMIRKEAKTGYEFRNFEKRKSQLSSPSDALLG